MTEQLFFDFVGTLDTTIMIIGVVTIINAITNLYLLFRWRNYDREREHQKHIDYVDMMSIKPLRSIKEDAMKDLLEMNRQLYDDLKAELAHIQAMKGQTDISDDERIKESRQ